MFGDWRPHAVVFDCDGLLVDTESCWTRAEAAMCAARGVAFSDDDEAALIGASVPRVCWLLAARFGDGATPEAVQDELVARVTDVVGREARAMAGALALVRLARARVPIAVASNSPRTLLDQALWRGGLSGLFEATIAADEVGAPKPAPDVYRLACERLGVAPHDALALEDSAVGVAAARAAGLRTVGVPTLAHAPLGAQATVARLTDTALVDWVQSWSLR